MRRAQLINGFGAVMTGVVLVTVLITKFLLRRLDRDRRDGRVLRAHARDQAALRPCRRGARCRGDRHRPALAQPRDRAGRPAAPADHAGDLLRPRDAAGRAGGRDGERRRRRHPPARARVGPAQDPGVAQGRRVALPGDHQAGAGLRQAGAHEEPARRRHGVRARVRRRALVGAGPAQPERAADQDPPAVPAGRDGGIGAMAAEVVRADRRTGRADPRRRPPGLPDRAARRPARRAVAVRAASRHRDRPAGATTTAAAGTGPVPARRSRDRPAAHPDGGRPVTAAAAGHPRLDGPRARPGRRRGRRRRALRRAGPGRRRARAGRVRPARAAGGAGARGRHRRRWRCVLPRRRDRRARSRSGPGRAAVPVGPRRWLRGLRLAARRRAKQIIKAVIPVDP